MDTARKRARDGRGECHDGGSVDRKVDGGGVVFTESELERLEQAYEGQRGWSVPSPAHFGKPRLTCRVGQVSNMHFQGMEDHLFGAGYDIDEKLHPGSRCSYGLLREQEVDYGGESDFLGFGPHCS